MGGAQIVRVETSPGVAPRSRIRTDDRLRVIVANLRDRATTVGLDLPAAWRALDLATERVDLGPLIDTG